MSTFQLHVVTNTGSYVHGYNLGTDLTIARQCAEQVFHNIDIVHVAAIAPKVIPAGSTLVESVGLIRDNRFVDIYDGVDWFFKDLADQSEVHHG